MTMASHSRLTISPRILFGLLLMSVGLVFGLDTLGVIEAGQYLRFWPAILIAGGLIKLAFPGGVTAGLFWVVIGSGLLVHTLGIVEIWRLWPFGLFFLGAYIAYRALYPRSRSTTCGWSDGRSDEAAVFVAGRPHGRASAGPDRGAGESDGESPGSLNIVAVMGGVERKVRTKDFRGGSLVAFMGGCEVDLRDSSFESGEVVIDTTAIWGGIELKVPPDWLVESRGIAFLGGYGDKTHAPSDSTRRLVVTGLAVMGGVEIRN